ncbi:MAG TPA: hypothetical protein VHV77_11320, partial [Pirellulales bacterium]|nr:hypothetical protein [Pirellulales bacterium]
DATAFSTDASKLLAVRQVSTIISMALLEGSAFFGCAAYMLESQPWALGVVAAALLLMLVHFPTEGRLRTWLQWQTEELEEMRRQIR